jgi:hypothetical protein
VLLNTPRCAVTALSKKRSIREQNSALRHKSPGGCQPVVRLFMILLGDACL